MNRLAIIGRVVTKVSLTMLLCFLLGCAPETAPPPDLPDPIPTIKATAAPVLPEPSAIPVIAEPSPDSPTSPPPTTEPEPSVEVEVPTAELPISDAPTAEPIIIGMGNSNPVPIPVNTPFTLNAPRGAQWVIGFDDNALMLLTSDAERQEDGDCWAFVTREEVGTTRIWLTMAPPVCEGEMCDQLIPPQAAIEIDTFIEIVAE